jgi:kynurenine formamidase
VPLLLLAACAAPPPPATTDFDLDRYDVVDLTYTYDDDTIFWPTATRTFELERLSYGVGEGGFFYAANAFCTPEHGGTHMDAPIHFAADRHTIDQVAPERLIAQAVVIDVANQAASDPDYRLTLDDVKQFEGEHGVVPAGSVVLMRTGWGKLWGDAHAYLGDDTPGDASNLHFPSFGSEAVRYLIETRGVGMIGIDTASIDHGPSTDFSVHRLAGAANVPGLENVAALEQLPPTGAWVIALPMKIGGGSGGPVRIIALVPRATGVSK